MSDVRPTSHPRVVVIPGGGPDDGVVARRGDYLLYVRGQDHPAARELIEPAGDAVDDPETIDADRIVAEWDDAAAEPGGLPDFAAVIGLGAGAPTVVCHGESIHISTDHAGTSAEFHGRRTGLVSVRLDGPVHEIRAWAGGEARGAKSATLLDLVEGSVPGAGFDLIFAVVPPEATLPSGRPDAVQDPEPHFEIVDLGAGPSARRDPQPVSTPVDPAAVESPAAGVQVEGIRCVRGHFNHPDSAYCSLCGISMVQQTRTLVRDMRPPLGILVFETGQTFTLDTDYVLGREPTRSESVHAGTARPIELEDRQRILSRVHARVLLRGWDVFVVDPGSANGTFIWPPGGTQWLRLPQASETKIEPGTYVMIGTHRFGFDTHHGTR